MRFHSAKRVVQTWLINNHSRLKRMLPDRYFVFRYPGGRIYWNPGNSPGMLARVLGIYEADKMATVLKLLTSGSTFVDVGANVGDYSLLAARIVGHAGKVLCFEPEPRNRYWLQRAIDLNGYGNIEVYAVALSDRNGQVPLYLGEIAGYHSLIPGLPERQAGTISVTTRTLDSLLEELGRDRIDMMKIDVEGAELQVLRGARATLEKNPDIILLLELHPGLGVNPAEVCNFLRQLGFSESGACWSRNTRICAAR
jgi:FkbM family methyltransferase